jgi:hypothetical protein
MGKYETIAPSPGAHFPAPKLAEADEFIFPQSIVLL